MPIYIFRCEPCEEGFERMLPMSEYKAPQNCPFCGEIAQKLVAPVNFNLPGDDWASKNGRLAKQMRDKNKVLTAKQNERHRDQPMISLAPNVDGERVGTWSEAQKLAASKGKQAASYDSVVRKEQLAKK